MKEISSIRRTFTLYYLWEILAT